MQTQQESDISQLNTYPVYLVDQTARWMMDIHMLVFFKVITLTMFLSMLNKSGCNPVASHNNATKNSSGKVSRVNPYNFINILEASPCTDKHDLLIVVHSSSKVIIALCGIVVHSSSKVIIALCGIVVHSSSKAIIALCGIVDHSSSEVIVALWNSSSSPQQGNYCTM